MPFATRLLHLISLGFMAGAASFAHADKFQYPAQRVTAAGIHALKISGVKGRLVLKGNDAKFFTVKISHSKNKRFEDWSLLVDRQGETLVLEVFNVALGAQWRHEVRQELWPEFDITIEGPSVPAVISWREGDFAVARWRSDIEASFLSGAFRSVDTRGVLKLQAVDGRLNLRGHEGELRLKGEKGRVDMVGVKGSVDINWLHGVLRANDLSGPSAIDMPGGNAQLSGVRGKLKVTGQNSEWDIQAAAPGDLEIVSDSGPVRVRFAGGAMLFLTSNTGRISVPKPWRVEDRDGLKVVEANPKAGALKSSRGQVFVRTQSGNISWQ